MSSHHNKKDFANQERQKMKLNKPDNLFQDLHSQLKMLTELLKNNKSGVEHYDLKSTPTNVDKVLGHYVKQLGSLGKWSSGTNPAPKYWEVS